MAQVSVNSFKTGFTTEQLRDYQRGVMAYRYKGLPCLKSPIDIAIYMRILGDKKPRTIFEIGSRHGGSAVMFRDLSRATGGEARVVSVDLHPPRIDHQEQISFLTGDAMELDKALGPEMLTQCQRPWMVIEDSAHTYATTTAVMNFFAPKLRAGEYLIIEDGVLEDLGWAKDYDGGPNRAIAAFLEKHPGEFDVDRACCDMFGRNMTYNPNGYLVKK